MCYRLDGILCRIGDGSLAVMSVAVTTDLFGGGTRNGCLVIAEDEDVLLLYL